MRASALIYRVFGVLAVACTIVIAVNNVTALWAWLIGLVVGLVGWGFIQTAARLSVSDLQRYGRARGDDPGVLLDLLLSRLSLPVARRVEFLMGAILIFAGLALAVGSVFAP